MKGLVKGKVCLCMMLILGMIIAPSLAAESYDPTEIGVGARVLGMGRAYTGVADDGSAMFTNPAGMGLSNNFQLISMNGNLMSEVPYNMAGLNLPFYGGNVGIGYVGSSLSGISETTLVNGTPEMTGNSGSFANNEIIKAVKGKH